MLHVIVVYFVDRNESGVGRGMKKSGIPRSDVFVVTKVLWDDHGRESCEKALAESLKK